MLWHTWFYDVFSQGGFDIVIANPPYIDSESMTNQGMGEIRNILVKQFELSGNWDIYMAFYEQAFAITQNIVCFITPDKWLSKPFGNKFRATKMMSRMCSILHAGSKVFDNATVDAIISLFNKESNKLTTKRFTSKKDIITICQTSKDQIIEPYYIDYLFSNNVSLINKIEFRSPIVLSDIASCENACATSDCYALLPYIENNSTPKHGKEYKLINTGTISKYNYRWGEKECTYLKHKFLCPVVNIDKFEKAEDIGKSYKNRARLPKIIMKGLNLMDACIDEACDVLPGKTTLVIHPKDVSNLYYLLAMLNSKLASFYIKTKFSSSSYCGGITFTKDMINRLPIFSPNDNTEIITKRVKEIMQSKQENFSTDTSALEYEIDRLVYQLYGLTEDEIKIVEES